MKVVYVAPEYPSPGENAAQVRANAILPRLASHIDLRILAFPPHGVAAEKVKDPAIVTVDRGKVGRANLLRGTLSRRPRVFLRYGTGHAQAALASMIESFQPDIVHFDSIGTLALFEVARTASVRPRIIAQTHDAVSLLYERLTHTGPPIARALAWSEYRKFTRFEREVLSRCDTIVVDSPEDADFLRQCTGGTRVEVVPIGVDFRRFSREGQHAELEPSSIVFSGNMGSEQSADAATFLVNDVMPIVWQRHPRAIVYLAGSNPLPKVSALAGPRVHVTGFVNDLAAYLRAADVYVCPLRLGSGMRTRVIEALACGARTVSTSFGVRGLAVEYGERPTWFIGNTVETMAAGIVGLLDGAEPDLADRAVAYAARQYSWDGVAKQMSGIYRQLGGQEGTQ